MGDESLSSEKSLTPDAAQKAPKATEPLCPSRTRDSPVPVNTPSPSVAKKTPTKMTLNPSATSASSSSKLVQSTRKKTTPLIPQSHGLGVSGGVPSGGYSARPQAENPPQSLQRVAKSLAKDLDFIKAGFHIRRFVTAALNTEAERANI
jgi:type IV secretory pathway VirB10-like protein